MRLAMSSFSEQSLSVPTRMTLVARTTPSSYFATSSQMNSSVR